MFHKRLRVATVLAAVAVGLSTGSALAASPGTNSGSPPDQGNCLGNFQNEGSNGYFVSNLGPPAPSGLGQFVGKEEHGCRG